MKASKIEDLKFDMPTSGDGEVELWGINIPLDKFYELQMLAPKVIEEYFFSIADRIYLDDVYGVDVVTGNRSDNVDANSWYGNIKIKTRDGDDFIDCNIDRDRTAEINPGKGDDIIRFSGLNIETSKSKITRLKQG